MPIEAVKIPQNVYVEDRIIGPITLRQLMMVMITGGVSYAVWTGLTTSGYTGPLPTALAWTPTVLGGMFAFVRINNISLFRIVLLSLEKLEKPSTRIWTPRRGMYVNLSVSTEPPRRENTDIELKRQSHESARLEELSEVLDKGPTEITGGYDSDIDTKAKQEDEEILEAELRPTAPVNREKIRADARDTPATLDGVSGPSRGASTSPSSGLLRDILPPSHA